MASPARIAREAREAHDLADSRGENGRHCALEEHGLDFAPSSAMPSRLTISSFVIAVSGIALLAAQGCSASNSSSEFRKRAGGATDGTGNGDGTGASPGNGGGTGSFGGNGTNGGTTPTGACVNLQCKQV